MMMVMVMMMMMMMMTMMMMMVVVVVVVVGVMASTKAQFENPSNSPKGSLKKLPWRSNRSLAYGGTSVGWKQMTLLCGMWCDDVT